MASKLLCSLFSPPGRVRKMAVSFSGVALCVFQEHRECFSFPDFLVAFGQPSLFFSTLVVGALFFFSPDRTFWIGAGGPLSVSEETSFSQRELSPPFNSSETSFPPPLAILFQLVRGGSFFDFPFAMWLSVDTCVLFFLGRKYDFFPPPSLSKISLSLGIVP